MKEIVRLEQLCIRGSGYYQMENFNMLVMQGQFVCLWEPDGYGTDALAEVFMGRKTVFSGKILFNGEQISPDKEIFFEKEGVYVVSVDESMQPCMSVEENLFLSWKKNLFMPWFMKHSLRTQAVGLFKKLDININPEDKVQDLPFEDRQLLKLARAYCKGAKLIVINGIVDAISSKRQIQLMNLIRKLCAQNIAILCISHKVHKFFNVSDMLILIKNGTKIWTMMKPDVNIEKAVHIYYSKVILFDRVSVNPDERVFMEIYRNERKVFTARYGRCIGVYAQERRMLDEFLKLLTGERKISGMRMVVEGSIFNPKGYGQCVKKGIGQVDIQSLRNNFSDNLCLAENIYLQDMKKLSVMGVFRNIRYEKFLVDKFNLPKRVILNTIKSDQNLWDMLFFKLIQGSLRIIIFYGSLPANFGENNICYIQKLIEKGKILIFLSVNMEDLKMFCHELYNCENILP